MSEFKEWFKTLNVVKTGGVIFTVFMAIVGGSNAIWDLFNKWSDSQKPKSASVMIEVMDFQDSKIDRIIFNFRNATKEGTSIHSVGLSCKSISGDMLQYNAFNNEIGKMKHMFDISKYNIVTTPKNLDGGDSIRLETIYLKQSESESINKICLSLAPVWTDNEYKKHYGDWVDVKASSAYWSQVVTHKS